MPIQKISFMGEKELIWDWETYHDSAAVNVPDSDRSVPKSVCTFDNPFNPWRDANGDVFVIAANFVNYRVPLDKNLRPARVLNSGDIIFHSGYTYPHSINPETYYHRSYGGGQLTGSCVEADYDNDFWIFSPWTDDGRTFSALCHHEFYPGYCPVGTNEHWINAIHHMTSYNWGKMFLPQPYRSFEENGGHSNSHRLVLVPEPSGTRPLPPKFTYGFYHPSNIVREGDYCYALCSASNWLGETYTDEHGDVYGRNEEGFVMIRSLSPMDPRAWEVFTPVGWRTINVNTWQGWHIPGIGGQEVKLWHRQERCPHLAPPWASGGQGLTLRLVYHRDSQQWIAFGYANQGARTVCYTLSDSLANPNWEEHGISLVEDGPNGEQVVLQMGNYPSIVDPTSEDYVFQFTGYYPFLYFVEKTVNFTNEHSRNIWRVPLKIEVKISEKPKRPI